MGAIQVLSLRPSLIVNTYLPRYLPSQLRDLAYNYVILLL